MSQVQPGDLVFFQKRALEIASKAPQIQRRLRLIKAGSSSPDRLLEEEEGLSTIFLFLKFEPLEHIGATRIWVLFEESMWYVWVTTLIDVSYAKYVRQARQPSI